MYSKPIAPADSRGSFTSVTIECTRLFLEKWRLEEGGILSRIDGQQYSTNCPEIKWRQHKSHSIILVETDFVIVSTRTR
jgi:hypothetical protein